MVNETFKKGQVVSKPYLKFFISSLQRNKEHQLKMKIINKLKFAGLVITLLAVAAGSSSCKKEYIDKYNTQTVTLIGDNHINSFAVKEFSADTTLYATIKNDSIIVYWPAYKALPATISPVITLPDSASISPASGEEVAFETGVTYTITSGANTVKTYKLVVSPRQQTPQVFSAYAAAANVGSFYQATSLSGDFFIPDINQTRVIFIGKDTKTEYQADVTKVSTYGPSIFIPDAPTDQKYTIKFINLFAEVLVENVTLAIKSSPTLYDYELPTTFKAGDTFTIRAASGHLVAQLDGRLSSNSTYYPFEVVERKTDRVVVKVPEDMPKGTYNRFYIRNEAGTGIAALTYSFTITE